MSEPLRREPGTMGARILMGLLFAVALAVGYLILPGEPERIAMLERDGKYKSALAILERRLDAGDRSQRRLYQLQGIYLHYGDLVKSRQMLELLARQRPDDADVQRRLIAFYKQLQDADAYEAALEARIRLRYSEAVCNELIGIRRQRGDFDGELAALKTCRQRGYRRVEDLVRLAMLQATAGELQPASLVLRNIDDLRRLRSDQERMLLFSTLLDLDLAREAQRRAVRWLRGGGNEQLALAMIERMARAAQPDLALQLARDLGEPGSSIALAVAELLLNRSEYVAARSYLRGWLSQAALDDPVVVTRFIESALDAEDPQLAYQAAERYGLSNVGPEALVALAEALGATERSPEFDRIIGILGPEVVAANALLAAAAGLRTGAKSQTRVLLAQVRVDELDEWRLALWAKLMEQTGRGGIASSTLRSLVPEPVPAASAPTATPRAATPPRIIRRISRTKNLRLRRRGPAGTAVVVRRAGAPAPPGSGATVQLSPPGG